jgi:hypothetical protein
MMKRKLFFTAIAFTVIGTASFTWFASGKAETEETILDRNVEALASGEDSGTGKACYSSITAKDGCMVRYCPTCSFVSGTDTWYSIHQTCTGGE